MKYVSIDNFDIYYGKSIIINFELNMKEKEFNELKLKDCRFHDMPFSNYYKTVNEFFDNDWFNNYFKESFNMSDTQVSMFHELLSELKILIDKFSVSEISLYNYIMKTNELRKTWNDQYPEYEIEGFTESSFKISYLKYLKRGK